MQAEERQFLIEQHLQKVEFASLEELSEKVDVSVSTVKFSPDGRMVTFLWKKDKEERAVWGIPVDGGAQVKLAAVKDTGVRSYAWTPDGSTIYLLASAAPVSTMRPWCITATSSA